MAAHLSIFNKTFLLDAGIYGFVLIRQLDGTGFDLRLRLRDLVIGLRECAFYTPVALLIGLGLGFLHFHPGWPAPLHVALAWIFTFFFIAVPEELFFRGWLQNLLEKRIGHYGALILTACLFGLAHFNKRTTTFNWRYVLLATLAGIFYGRAWRDRPPRRFIVRHPRNRRHHLVAMAAVVITFWENTPCAAYAPSSIRRNSGRPNLQGRCSWGRACRLYVRYPNPTRML